MTNRERVIASLRHEQPDRTPYHIELTFKARERLIAHPKGPEALERLSNCCYKLSTEIPGQAWREVRPDIWEDQFGVRWNRSVDKDIGVVCNQVVREDNLESYVFPDPHDAERWEWYPDAIAVSAGRFVLPELGFSLFERAWTLYGMENLLVAMASNPSFAHKLFDRILEYNLAIIGHACSYAIDGMEFGDDWGSQSGLIMGAELWREFIGPRVRQMYQAVHAHGKYVFIHSCGKVDELFSDLIESGLDCFNPFQPEVMDPFEMKRRYGARLSFWGGVSTQRTLPYASEEAVKEEVRRLLREVGKDGGYIAAPAHAAPGDAKPENIIAMIEALTEQ